MTQTPDQPYQYLETKIADLYFGLRMVTFLFLLTASVGNILSAFCIASFHRLFMDAMPGRPLPEITLLVLYFEPLLKVSALLLPLVGLGTFFIRGNVRLVMTLLAVTLTITLVQSGFVVEALRLPMTIFIEGMGGPNPP